MARKKALPPRVKRLKRQGRLQVARKWLPTYKGKNILRGYCNHFNVDWRCAAIELKALGVKLDPGYLDRREKTEAALSRKRQERREKQVAEQRDRENQAKQHWHPYTNTFDAYLAGDFAALHDLELREAAQYDAGFDQDVSF